MEFVNVIKSNEKTNIRHQKCKQKASNIVFAENNVPLALSF